MVVLTGVRCACQASFMRNCTRLLHGKREPSRSTRLRVLSSGLGRGRGAGREWECHSPDGWLAGSRSPDTGTQPLAQHNIMWERPQLPCVCDQALPAEEGGQVSPMRSRHLRVGLAFDRLVWPYDCPRGVLDLLDRGRVQMLRATPASVVEQQDPVAIVENG